MLPLPAAGQGSGDWALVWADEFNQDGVPNPANWGYEAGFVRNQELQWYQPQNAFCSNGLLVIEGRREQVPNPNYDPNSTDWKKNRPYAEYTSASLRTRNKFSWRYGRLEVRARINVQSGMWPAIWTLGIAGEWPSNGEVDVMEYYLRSGVPTILANTAWGTATRWVAQWDGASKPLSYFLNQDPNWVSKFHIWSMDWDENSIRLYLDGELMNFTDLAQTLNADGSNPFHQPHYLILNLAIGSNGGDPSGSTFPARYEVDYARVYESNYTADGWVKVDDRDPGLDYTGWGTWDGNPGFQGTEHFSETTGAEATFTFTGARARYHGFKRNDLGHAQILLDGVPQGSVDCYQAVAAYDVMLYETPELPHTEHTLKVRVAGVKNPASSGTEVIVDAFAFRSAQVGDPWQQRWFTESQIRDHPEITSAASDYDGDGIPALAESIYGGNPLSASDVPPRAVRVGPGVSDRVVHYEIERLLDRAGVTAWIGFSTNLTSWQNLSEWPGVVETLSPSVRAGYEQVRLEIPLPANLNRFFLRSSAAVQ